ncbi:NAD kinase 2, mitochondrial [Strongyloides ratti]|uniref:NAD(+) kinase n=1 Tax=Strongyloides ratti TaxID=34506 RepID=A0A090KPX6_STRRB|nr:NAD kinase 2, mitochondrial [Strongyloides ratti]CEF59434.1 NAD kinase 2, mitochondrial [Strongyloides ratti]
MQSIYTPFTNLLNSNNTVVNEPLNKEKVLKENYLLLKNSEKNFFPPRKVLIISKTTRLQWEMSLKDVNYKKIKNEKVFFDEISNENISPHIIVKHLKHIKYVNKIIHALKKHCIQIKIIYFDEYNENSSKGFDLIITAGGDGTFLTGASKIKNNIPIIGLNSDYHGSEGYLCIGKKMNIPPKIIINKFLEKKFDWMYRQRIKVIVKERSITKEKNMLVNKKIFYVLNEVFISEINSGKVSYFEVSINNEKPVKQKNSGISICTGTGSTAWHFNINKLYDDKLKSIINVLENMGVIFENKNSNFIKEVCNRYNKKLIFDPFCCQMAYTFREPIYNNTFHQMSQKGFTRNIKIISKCSNGGLFLDGNNLIPINFNSEIILQILPEDSLKTVYMNFDN